MQPKNERFELRLDTNILERLDIWRSKQQDNLTRSEAVRRLIEAGLRSETPYGVQLSDGEKLILFVLSDMRQGRKNGVNMDMVEEVILGGHYWALDWAMRGIFHDHKDRPEVVNEVVDILDMWSFLEDGYAALNSEGKKLVADKGGFLGSHVNFTGFDGNNEAEHLGVARLLTEKLGRFDKFKGRGLNSHIPSLSRYRAMLPVFKKVLNSLGLGGQPLGATEIAKIMKASE